MRTAAGLAISQTKYEADLKKQQKKRRREFWRSVMVAAASVGIKQFSTGFSEARLGGAGFGEAFGAGFSGYEFEGDRFGGLLNFTGGRGDLPSTLPRVRQARIDETLDALGSRVFTGLQHGGVVTEPTMALMGEGASNEAVVPLPNGRSIPVDFGSGGGRGGEDDAIVTAINNLGDELGGSGETVINITVNSDGTETQDTNGDDERQQNLALRIRDVVRQTIEEEQRLGGSLRRA
jgi:hypothetical protein